MEMNDMVVISTDDHICEPPTLFDNQLSGELLASAPKLRTDSEGKNFWEYQGTLRPSIGLNAVVGRPREDWLVEPTRFDEMRRGAWDIEARIAVQRRIPACRADGDDELHGRSPAAIPARRV